MAIGALGIRFGLALLFLIAGLTKLPPGAEFKRAVEDYRLLPRSLVPLVAVTLPAVELICGGLLALGFLIRVAASVLAILLIGFVTAISVNLLRGRAIGCGCLGVAPSTRISWWLVVRNGILAASAVVLAIRAPDALSLSLSQGPTSGIGTSDAIAILASSTALFAAGLLAAQFLRLWKAASVVSLLRKSQ